jgi:hypothetical protein
LMLQKPSRLAELDSELLGGLPSCGYGGAAHRLVPEADGRGDIPSCFLRRQGPLRLMVLENPLCAWFPLPLVARLVFPPRVALHSWRPWRLCSG